MNTENVRTAGNDSSVGEIIEPSFDLELPLQDFVEADVSVFSIPNVTVDQPETRPLSSQTVLGLFDKVLDLDKILPNTDMSIPSKVGLGLNVTIATEADKLSSADLKGKKISRPKRKQKPLGLNENAPSDLGHSSTSTPETKRIGRPKCKPNKGKPSTAQKQNLKPLLGLIVFL